MWMILLIYASKNQFEKQLCVGLASLGQEREFVIFLKLYLHIILEVLPVSFKGGIRFVELMLVCLCVSV